MSKQSDKAKGRAKETVGRATGDEKLEREGKVDKAQGKTKEAVEGAADKVKDVMNERRRRR